MFNLIYNLETEEKLEDILLKYVYINPKTGLIKVIRTMQEYLIFGCLGVCIKDNQIATSGIIVLPDNFFNKNDLGLFVDYRFKKCLPYYECGQIMSHNLLRVFQKPQKWYQLYNLE